MTTSGYLEVRIVPPIVRAKDYSRWLTFKFADWPDAVAHALLRGFIHLIITGDQPEPWYEISNNL